MTGLIILAVYVGIFVGGYLILSKMMGRVGTRDYTSLKTVTFGDESAVRPNRRTSSTAGTTTTTRFASVPVSRRTPSASVASG